MKSKILGLLALGLLAGPMSAGALDFQFSFTDTTGPTPGTVTGRILGLQDNTSSAASQVLIDSFPGEFNSVAGLPPIEATLWDQQYENSFTVLNGQVIGGGYWAWQTAFGYLNGYSLYIHAAADFFGGDGQNALSVFPLAVVAEYGLAAANIVPYSSVPEPGTLALLGLGLAGLGLNRRRLIH